jgi:hypothetical protein
MIYGRANKEEPEHGMVVTFDDPCRSISDLDLLLIQAPSGEPLRLMPDEPRDAKSVYVFFGLGTHAQSLRGWLERVDDSRWRFNMEPHHIELKQADVI